MVTRQKMIALAAAFALGAPSAVLAQAPGFTYLEGGVMAGFVNDVGRSGSFDGGSGPLELETDAGGGAFIGGAWEFTETLHVFGEYSSVGQELEVRGGTSTVEGDFDVARWRIGVGYAHAVSDATSVYGRLSYDGVELKDFQVAGFSFDDEADGDGIGAEAGVVWAATPRFHLQGHVRYTAVGEIAAEGSETFDSDILIGVNARWYVRPSLALVTGYELGNITTWNLGLRFAF